MRNSLIQLPHRLLVYNVVTVIRVNLTTEEIRQNCCYAPGIGMKHLGLIRWLLNLLLWLISCSTRRCGIHQRGRMRLIQFLFRTYGVDEVAEVIKAKRETMQA